MATTGTKVLPSLFLNMNFSEVGSIMVGDLKTKNHHTHDGKCVESGNEEHTFVFVLPDGVLITGEKENWSGNKDFELSVDFKSPFFRTLAHLACVQTRLVYRNRIELNGKLKIHSQ